MNEDEKASKFLKDKNAVIEKLESIKLDVMRFSDEDETFDPESNLYNQIDTVLDEAEGVSSYPELLEIINYGKQFEKNIDVWLAKQGQTTVEIHWPEIPREE